MVAKQREPRREPERPSDDHPTAPSRARPSGLKRRAQVDVIEVDAARTFDPRRELEVDDDDERW